MSLPAIVISTLLSGATVLVPLASTQVLIGAKPQGRVQMPAAIDPSSRAPALKIKLSPPKTGPKVLNPHAALREAAIIAVLQRQKQAADVEAAQMKIGIRAASQTGPPAIQSQPTPASGGSSLNKTKAPVPVNIQKTPAAAAIGPAKVSDVSGNNSSQYARAHPIDTTVLTCSNDPTTRILKVSGDAAPATFTPIDKYNLYTISGCSFGGANASNKVYVFGKGSFQGNFLIRLWSENSITVALDPALSGFPDQDNLTLVVQRADGVQANKNGFKFYAARGDAQGNPVVLPAIASSQFSTKMPFDSQTLITPNTYASPSPDSTATDPMTEVGRLYDTPPWAPTTDTFKLGNLAAGFVPASASLTYWYIVPTDCPGFLQPPKNPVRKLGDPKLDIQGYWDMKWDADNLVVHTQVEGCRQGYVGAGNSNAGYFTSFSRYAVEVWVLGPRCLDPWTGQRMEACVANVKKQQGQP